MLTGGPAAAGAAPGAPLGGPPGAALVASVGGLAVGWALAASGNIKVAAQSNPKHTVLASLLRLTGVEIVWGIRAGIKSG
jgi:hypothetical protein